MERKRILVMSDSAKLHTGFACVTRELFLYLQRTGKYDIQQIGWFHQETNEEITWPIHTTEKDLQGKLTQEDKYAHRSFPAYVEKLKPDLVWTLGDEWMIDHVSRSPNRKKFKWVGYFPIDGHPSPSKWGPVMEDMDVAVAYGKYGMEVIRRRAPKANLMYIYHGVDSEAFHPIPEIEKKEARKQLIGLVEEKILLGVVARNQPRKAFDKLFEAYFYILGGHYITCSECQKVTVFPFDLITRGITNLTKCKHCGSLGVVRGQPRDDVRVYIHGALVDCGWDLLDLQTDYNLHGKVLVNPNLKIGAGVSEFVLNGIYNCMDIFTLPTRGEGFGLPIIEAMSCGLPVVVTDYSAHPEWVRGCGELIPPAVLESEPLTNIRRAIIDMDLYVTSLLKLINNPELRKAYGKLAREKAISMDWKNICKQWECLLDSVLYPDGNVPKAVDPSEMKYTLEVM